MSYSLPSIAVGLGAGLFFALLPQGPEAWVPVTVQALPLVGVGLAWGLRYMWLAVLMACVAVGFMAGLPTSLFYAVCVVLPYFFGVAGLMRVRGEKGALEWYPALTVIAGLSFFCAVAFLLFGALHHLVSHTTLADAFRDLLNLHRAGPPLTQSAIAFLVANLLAQLTFAWVMLLYLAHFTLQLGNFALRPTLLLTPVRLPAALLGFLAASGVLAAFGKGDTRFEGVVAGVLLLQPFAYAGLAELFVTSQAFKWRTFWLFLFFCLSVFSVWPLALLTLAGLYRQICLNAGQGK